MASPNHTEGQDTQGAEQIRDCSDSDIQQALVDLFVMPPSEQELHARLSGRGTDSAETIALRMKNALEEIKRWDRYEYRLLSSTKERDYEEFLALITAERLRISRIIKS